MDLREQLQTSLGNVYTLERELGGGGMSRTFVAHEAAVGRKVVVKMLSLELAAGVSIDRFKMTDKALVHYQSFLNLWKNADPELQPRVRDVRGRVTRLEAALARKG